MNRWVCVVWAAIAACDADLGPLPAGGRAAADPPPETSSPTPDTALAPEPPRFGLPVADPDALEERIGVDHDPVIQEGLLGLAVCSDYLGRPFPHCYDEHHGTDLLLAGGFGAMDAGSVEVLAARDGIVVTAVDGNYDRCHLDGSGVTCDGYPQEANLVEIDHPDGLRTRYLHLMNGSVAVQVGQAVACGDVLGRIGSSGNSSQPHLHFEVRRGEQWVDPFAGPNSQAESLWQDQGDEDDLPGPGCTDRDPARR